MHIVRSIVTLLVSLSLLGCSDAPAPQKRTPKPHLVEVVSAQRAVLAVERERTGTLRAQQEIQVFNQEEGRITSLPFYAGDRVRAGDVVARLDDALLRAQLARTQALRRKAGKDLARIGELIDKRLTAQTELTRAETELAVARADEQMLLTRLAYTTVRAPIAGVISQRLSEPGNIAERYTHLLTISDQRTLITEVAVSELLINKLRQGDNVAVSIDALGSEAGLQGVITRIYPNLDPVTRTGTVEIGLDSPPPGARPGQLVRVRLRTQASERLLIPFSALRRSVDGEYLFTLDETQQVVKTTVVTGLRIGEQVEILSGLAPGSQVVTRGFTNLRAGMSVKQVDAAVPESTLTTLPARSPAVQDTVTDTPIPATLQSGTPKPAANASNMSAKQSTQP